MYVFTRELNEPRLKAKAGMPVPARLDTSLGRKMLVRQFGADVIAEVDYRNPDSFMKLFSGSGEELKTQYAKLKMVADQQATKIRDLERENEGLKKQLKRQPPQA